MKEREEYIGNWTEIASRLNIEVDEGQFSGTFAEMRQPEVIKKRFFLNGAKIEVELKDQEERLAQKIKQYINDHLDDDVFTNSKIREGITAHLMLIADAKTLNEPVFRAIAEVENDWTFAAWVCDNLERLSS